jgi:hypothetical protein
MPLTLGEKLPVEIFDIKKLIQKRLPEYVSNHEGNNKEYFLNYYLRYVSALKRGRYNLVVMNTS